MGFVTTFLLVIVVLPIAAIIWKSTGNGWSGFWDVVSSPQAVAAFKLTLILSTLAVLTTAGRPAYRPDPAVVNLVPAPRQAT